MKKNLLWVVVVMIIFTGCSFKKGEYDFDKAVEKDDYITTAFMYSSGFGVEKDEIKGFELYKKYADDLSLSKLYEKGYTEMEYNYRESGNYRNSRTLKMKLPDSEKNNPNRYKIAFDYYESFYKDYKQKDINLLGKILAKFSDSEIENLVERDIEVTIIEKSNQVLAPVDFEIASEVHQHIKEFKTELFLNDGAKEFIEIGDKTKVKLESGIEIIADIIIMAIGVRPENKLALEAGLEIGKTGGIKVNEYLQTSDEDIYAVGDAIEVKHYINGAESLIPLAWPANRQGRIVADTILGIRQKPYTGSLGTSILKAFDLTVSATGLNEKTLKRLGIPYMVTTVNRNDHASYYPGATPLTLKLIFNKEGDILGAQAIGYKGVDKRIDIIATAIKGNLKVWDLQEVEVAYAPPYNSAKDPVNIAGYAAENMINGEHETFRYFEIDELLQDSNYQLLDVRTKMENRLGTIKDSINIDVNELRDNLDSLNRDKTYLVFCQVGLRGYLAYRILVQNGFKVKNLDGGYRLWSHTVQEQENKNIFKEDNFKHKDLNSCEEVKELVDEEKEV